MANYSKMGTRPLKRALEQSNVFSSTLHRANPNSRAFQEGQFDSAEGIRKAMRVSGSAGTPAAPMAPLPMHETDHTLPETNVEIRLTFPIPQTSDENPFVRGMPIFAHGNSSNARCVHGIRLTDVNRFLEIGSDEFHKEMEKTEKTGLPTLFVNGPESGIRYIVVEAYKMQDMYRMLGLCFTDGFQTDNSIRAAASGQVRTHTPVKPGTSSPHDATLAVRGMFDNAQQVYSSAPTPSDFCGFFLIRDETTDGPRIMVTSDKPEIDQRQIRALQLAPYCFPNRSFPMFTRPTERLFQWSWGNQQYMAPTTNRRNYGKLHAGLGTQQQLRALTRPAGTIAAAIHGGHVEFLSSADASQMYGITVGGRCYGDYISVISRIPVIHAAEPGQRTLKNKYLRDSFTPHHHSTLYHIITYGCHYPVGSIRLRRTGEPGPPADALKSMVSNTDHFRRAYEWCDLQLNINRY